MSNGIGVKQDNSGIGVKVQGGSSPYYGGGIRQPTRLAAPGMCFYHQQIPATYICNKCGRAICSNCAQGYGSLTFCPQCNPYPGAPQPQYYQPQPQKGNYAGAGGALIITAGIIGLVFSVLFLLISFSFLVGIVFMVVELVFSVLAIIGGICAVQRSSFGLAIMGGVFGLLSSGFIFGLIGLILVAISKHEFRN